MSMCQVSLFEPGLLSRVRLRNMASTGLSRDVPGVRRSAGADTGVASAARASAGTGAGAAAGATGANSSLSFLSMRSVSLPPGTHRFSRSSFWRNSAFE